MNNREHARLHHMLEAAQKAVNFTQNRQRNDMETKQKYPDIPWQQMAGTRDRLIHGYFSVDMDIVWRIVQNDLPPLIPSLQTVIDETS